MSLQARGLDEEVIWEGFGDYTKNMNMKKYHEKEKL